MLPPHPRSAVRTKVRGDLLGFVKGACRIAKAANGETPLLIPRLRGGSSGRGTVVCAIAPGKWQSSR